MSALERASVGEDIVTFIDFLVGPVRKGIAREPLPLCQSPLDAYNRVPGGCRERMARVQGSLISLLLLLRGHGQSL
jgi:hypothetical protein